MISPLVKTQKVCLSSVHILIQNVIKNCTHLSVSLLIVYLMQFVWYILQVITFCLKWNFLFVHEFTYCRLCVCVCVCVCENEWVIFFRAVFPKLLYWCDAVVMGVLLETSSQKWKLIRNYWGGGCNGICF